MPQQRHSLLDTDADQKPAGNEPNWQSFAAPVLKTAVQQLLENLQAISVHKRWRCGMAPVCSLNSVSMPRPCSFVHAQLAG